MCITSDFCQASSSALALGSSFSRYCILCIFCVSEIFERCPELLLEESALQSYPLQCLVGRQTEYLLKEYYLGLCVVKRWILTIYPAVLSQLYFTGWLFMNLS